MLFNLLLFSLASWFLQQIAHSRCEPQARQWVPQPCRRRLAIGISASSRTCNSIQGVTLVLAILAGMLIGTPQAFGQISMSGNETRANTTVDNSQQKPDVAMEENGDYIVVWESFLTDGSGFGIYAQRYTAGGTTNGPEFLVNTTTAGDQRFPTVAMDDDGDHVITWMSQNQDGSGWGIYAQLYDNNNASVGGEFLVNTTTTGHQKQPAVAMDEDGNFCIVWMEIALDGSSFQIQGQRYNNTGGPVGTEFSPRAASATYQGYPVIGMDEDGDFVIAWQRKPGTNSLIMIQPFDNTGAQIGGNFPVTTGSPNNPQQEPSIDMDEDGNYVLAWESVGRDGSFEGVYAALIPQGTNNPISNEFLVNTTTTGHQMEPDVTMNEDGGFCIAWSSYVQDSSFGGVYVQAYNNTGGATGGETLVNTTTDNFQQFPAVVQHDETNEPIIVWQDGQIDDANTADGDDYGVFFQRFQAKCPTITFTAIPTDETCLNASDGVIAISGITGGVAPYMYSVDDGANFSSTATISSLSAGTYQVIVKDNNGCESSAVAVSVGTVPDNTNPTINCPADITASNDAGLCAATVSFNPTADDNCPGVSVSSLPASGTLFQVGTTQVTATATDAAGNTAECMFNVTVNDTEAPVASCDPANAGPSDLVVNTPIDIGAVGSATWTQQEIDDVTVASTDNCGIVSRTVFPNGFDCSNIGSPAVFTITLTDAASNSSTCTVTYNNIVDATPPEVSCPADITVNNDPGQCGAIVDFTPSATDLCPGVTVASLPASGTLFQVGTTQVTTTATDAAGNTAECMFNVTVNDNQDPVITCPADITVGNDAGLCAAVVSFNPTVDDNCPGVSVNALPASGTLFQVGTKQVTATATDAAGNTAECMFNVTVNDTEAPVASCDPANAGPSDLVVNMPIDIGAIGSATWTQQEIDDVTVASTDNCGIVSRTVFPDGFDCSNIGSPAVFTITLTDAANNSSTCTITYNNIVDATPPEVSCPADITVDNDPGQCGAIVDFTPTATDLCPGVTVASLPASGTFFQVGTTQVTATATDIGGNTAECSFNIIVNDAENPVVNCPADITVGNDPGVCGAVVTFNPTTSDNCPGVGSNAAPASGTLFPVGVTNVDFTATDAAGNTAQCDFNVTINDTENPVAVCQDINVYLNGAGTANIGLGDIDNGSTDNCGIILQGLSHGLITCDSLSFSPLKVSLTVADAAGNSSTCTSMVTVLDTLSVCNTAPIAVCQDISVAADANCQGIAIAADFDGGSSDPDGDPITFDVIPPGPYPLGITQVMLTLDDGNGGQDTCAATITVIDSTAPVAPLPPANMSFVCAADVQAPIDLTATDNCDGAITVSPVVQIIPGTCINDFTEVRTWTFTDSSGNSSMVSQTITVQDTLAPVAPIPPADLNLACASEVPIPVDLTATDNCDGDITVSPVIQITLGSCLNDFIEVRTWTFTDTCGNSSSVSQTIVVQDTIPPVAPAAPADLNLACASEVPAPVDLTATDNCDGDITVSPVIQVTPGNCINDFIEVRTWTFVDTCGNASSVSQTIVVQDTLAPVAPTPPADVIVACADEVPVSVDLTATDNCDGDITVSPTAEITPGDCANDFVMVRTWTFVDTCGNTSSVSQTISVQDTIKPTWVRPLPPSVLIASCGMIPPPDTLMATDNCDAFVPVVFTEDTIQAGQGFEYDTLCIRRRWTATDSCGNRRRRTQRIYVVDCPDPCNISGISVGPTITNDSTIRMMGGPICNDDGTYNVEICIQWKSNPIPDNIEIEINGSGGFIQIPIDGPQDYPEKCFTLENLPANGRLVTIFARIGREGCTYRARDLFRAPDRCDPPPTDCDITDANVQIEPVCQNGTVSTCIMIEGALLPADASRARAFIGGEVVEITQYTLVPGGAVVCFEGLGADGGNKDFFFMAEPGCSITKRAFLQMPRNCDGDPGDDDDDDCDITGITLNNTQCDGNGTYSLEFVVTYNDMPAGQLAVEVGHGANKNWSYHTVTRSPQTITINGLPSLGGYANVFIKSDNVGGCTWYERSWYRAPSDCGQNRDVDFTAPLDQIRVYPNPSEGKFFILIEQERTEKIEIIVNNALGQHVKTVEVESNKEEVIDFHNMPEGIYTLRILQGEVPVVKQVQIQR